MTAQLDPKRLGMTGGIVWGALLCVWRLVIASGVDYGTDALNLLMGIYPGFSMTYPGALVGAVWGFVDAFALLYIIAWLYNRLEGRL